MPKEINIFDQIFKEYAEPIFLPFIERLQKGLSIGMLSSITGLSELEIRAILKENNSEK
ncbi:MAG: hypothetical protein IPH96_00535 [Saprospiraceae bacterium]|nr:hypothetical protein [Saprospiraceae bacterium]